MEKIKAASLHCVISLTVVAGFIVFLNLFWYQNFFRITGVIEPLKVLFIIDVVLGPLLTLIVYKKGKKTLKFDLAVIVLMQLTAFTYGVYTIYQGKPSWLVLSGNSFDLVYQQEVPSAKPELNNGGLFSRPKLAYIPLNKQDVEVGAQ